jgi:eukaryotic-like serine/threonine-protein kinase
VLDLLTQLDSGLAGRYSIKRALGRGGMATVFLAQDLRHDRSVAIKVLHPELGAAVGPGRFHREIDIAAALQHPHIIPLFDSGQIGDLLYYVMAYAEGGSLRGRLRREKQLPLEEVLELTRQVASALSFAHSRGVVHRDIKPENILLEVDQAVVADFGLAQALIPSGEERITGSGLALGTPAYMSPEQATGERDLDGRSDLYSLACVVYEMLAGEPPFTGPSPQAIMARRLAGAVPELRVVRESVPDTVVQAVHRALAKAPADRFASVAQFSAALTQGATSGTSSVALSSPASRTKRRRWAIALTSIAVLGMLAMVVLGAQLRRSVAHPALDPNLVAIAPFEALGTGVTIWREGIMDLLSRNLDGAGPLRVVVPAVVLRHWGEMAHGTSAEELGRRTGARLCITGSVVSSGADSVLLAASVLDVATGETLGEARIDGAMSRLGLSVDSLTMQLLRAIGRTRPIGAVRLATVSSASLPALKAYLQGEQYFRRAAWDSAAGYFERAAELDPEFALAFHRIFESRGFPTPGLDSLVWTYALKAGALTRGLGVRESLLISADSILAPVAIGSVPDSIAPHSVTRAVATLQTAARRFPNDPEVWYQLGKARGRFGWLIGVGPREALASLNRSIRLDSAFAPAHVEALQVSMPAQGPEATARHLDAYLRLQPTGPPADVARLARMLMDPERVRTAAQTVLDTASSVLLYQTYTILEWWSDSAETATRVARHLAARPTDPNLSSDPDIGRKVLLYSLAWRGHLQAAYRLWSETWLAIFSELAALEGVPRDTASAVFGRLLAAEPWPSPKLVHALPWWYQDGDTLLLKTLVERTKAPRHAGADDPATRYLGEAAKAYLALGRRDTTAALQLFFSLSHFPNYGAVGDWERYMTIRLLNARSRHREALQRLDQEIRSSAWPYDVLIALERGRAQEGLANRDAAAAAYQDVVDTWANADPKLQPLVKEARAGLVRLRRSA